MRLATTIPALALLASTLAAPAELAPRAQTTVTVTVTKTATVCSSPTSSSKAPVSTNSSSSPPKSSSSSAVKSASSSVSASRSSSTSAASASASGAAPSNEIGKMKKLHDDFRYTYNAGPLNWSSTLADYAQNVANTCKFAHSNGPYGENLAAGAGGGYNVASGFNAWADEAKYYDWNNPGFSSQTGHFTQVVWKATSEVGCASAICPPGSIFDAKYGNALYVVCEYNRPGNVVGNNNQYFRDNVGTKRT